ncbi:MAG: hypothetical protein ABID04_03235, partial [Patescibacteria group bacterium]
MSLGENKKELFALLLIFLLGFGLRLYHLEESTYFGFDEARDAYLSQEIYQNRDLKIVGPPANAPGLFHGPMYWYFLGPLYLISGGNPLFVSVVFRLINALGIILIFYLAKNLFDSKVAFLSALI